MTFADAQRLLADAGQSHVLSFWDRLDEAARARLLGQIASIDWNAVARLLPSPAAPSRPQSTYQNLPERAISTGTPFVSKCGASVGMVFA